MEENSPEPIGETKEVNSSVEVKENMIQEDRNIKEKKSKPFLTLFLSVILLVIVGAAAFFIYTKGLYRYFLPESQEEQTKAKINVVKFASLDEFKSYLKKSQDNLLEVGSLGTTGMVSIQEGMPLKALEGDTGTSQAPVASRVSETNVQVKGIDEPDIIKTDGRTIFFSQEFGFYRTGLIEPSNVFNEKMIIPQDTAETALISAFPPDSLKKANSIEENGDLLLSKNTLFILSNNKVSAFDVSDVNDPKEKWNYEYDANVTIISSRLYAEKLFVIARANVNADNPCPIPLLKGRNNLEIACSEIYHPYSVIPVDATFTALELDMESGEIKNKISFIGSSGLSVVYMSPNAIYITYSLFGNMIEYFYNFFNENKDVLLSQNGLERLKKLKDLEISNQAKMTEFSLILEEYYASLSDDARLKAQTEFQNKLESYANEHSRELEKTGVIKVAVNGLSLLATGEVPGRLLNQFSLDEYQETLRAATTSSDSWTRGSLNDVYLLDKNLYLSGSILGLGEGEKIYSARFIEDKGYLVTFRETDPFYVLDLKDPKNPKVTGELKIPGYSSYLHPIEKDKILGIGKDENKVKISLFDVSQADNPVEVDKYIIDEYWSDILNTHHAFLMDNKHQIFFLPGSKGGYIFSFGEDKLSLVKAISLANAKRAVYINDFLYVLSDQEMVVYDEYSWEQLNKISL